MLKASDLRIMDEIELGEKLGELKETLFNLRFQHATGQLDNPMKIKETRHDIARVCTIMTEREFAINSDLFEAAADEGGSARKSAAAEVLEEEQEDVASDEDLDDEDDVEEESSEEEPE